VLKSLVAAGALAERDGRWQGWDVDALALPRSVREAVLGRAARLPAEARAVLDVAAVLGGRVGHAELRAVSGLAEPALLAALDALGRARLLVEAAPGDGRASSPAGAGGAGEDAYDFSHPLVRDAVYAAVGRARARLLHGAAAGALERLYGAGAMAHAEALAFHHTRAAAGGPPAAAARYLAEAGRRALAKHADRAAAGYLQAALDLSDAGGGAGDGGPPNGDDAPGDSRAGGVARHGAARGGEAELVELLARARQRLGEHDAALALWRRARSAAEAAGDPAGVAAAERRMGLAAATRGRHADALAHFDAGLAAASAAAAADVPGAGALAARLRLARATALQAVGRRDDALAESRAALAAAEALGAPGLLARAHRALLLLHAWTGPADAARAHGERAVALAAAAGEQALGWSAHWAMAILGGLTGDAAGHRPPRGRERATGRRDRLAGAAAVDGRGGDRVPGRRGRVAGGARARRAGHPGGARAGPAHAAAAAAGVDGPHLPRAGRPGSGPGARRGGVGGERRGGRTARRRRPAGRAARRARRWCPRTPAWPATS
jgi:tetratricopeptide (TPR) repeat protein